MMNDADRECLVLQAVVGYLMEHPYAICSARGLDGMRQFVLGLTRPGQPGEGMSRVKLIELSGIIL
jgi:hypothetical protein